LLASLAWAVARPRSAWPLVVVWVLLAWLGLEDRARWQPWPYQYALMLAAVAVGGGCAGGDRAEAAVRLVRWVLVAVYFWSGVHKLGPAFPRLVGFAFAGPDLEASGPGTAAALRAAAWLVGPFEVLTAVMLALPVRRLRRAGVVMAVATHLVILAGFIPTGRNPVVWPWNAAMAVLVPVAFWGGRGGAPAGPRSRPAAVRALGLSYGFLLGVAPAFSEPGRGWWPSYLGFHLYSGRGQRMVATFTSERAADRLPPGLRRWAGPSPHVPGFVELGVLEWAEGDLGAPAPSDPAVLLGAAQAIAQVSGAGPGDLFFYRDHPCLLRERGWAVHRPDEVMGFAELPELAPGTGAK
jgi:hypothetical protein